MERYADDGFAEACGRIEAVYIELAIKVGVLIGVKSCTASRPSAWESVQAPVRFRPLVSASPYLIGLGDGSWVPRTSAIVPLRPSAWLQFGYSRWVKLPNRDHVTSESRLDNFSGFCDTERLINALRVQPALNGVSWPRAGWGSRIDALRSAIQTASAPRSQGAPRRTSP